MASAPPYTKKRFSLENHRLPVSCVETGCFEAALNIELVVILPEGFGTGGDDDQCSPGLTGFHTFVPDELCISEDSKPVPIRLFTWVDDFVSSSPPTPGGRTFQGEASSEFPAWPQGFQFWHIPNRPTINGHHAPSSTSMHWTVPAKGWYFHGPGTQYRCLFRLRSGCERVPDFKDHAWCRVVVMPGIA